VLISRQVLAKLNGLDWRAVRRLVDVQTMLGLTLSDAAALVDQRLHREPYSKQEVCDILAVTPEDLDAISLSERSRRGESTVLRHATFALMLQIHNDSKMINLCRILHDSDSYAIHKSVAAEDNSLIVALLIELLQRIDGALCLSDDNCSLTRLM
jgi:hypothetical protein